MHFWLAQLQALSDPYCQSAPLVLNISETKRFRCSCPTGTLWESAYVASIGDVINDVTWYDDTTMFKFKVVAFRN